MDRIRCGFLATGSMGMSHVRLVREEFPNAAEIVAVCDTYVPNLDKAKEAAPEATTYSDPEQLIADSNIDAIFVSTPGFTHADFTAKCLAANKHVFGEKPVMTTRDGVREMVRLAEQHPDRVVLINHELRYSRYFQKVKDLIDSGEIGEPQMVWCKEFRGPFLKKVGDWIQDARYSGGCLVDKNCHHFDLMNWWIGSRPKRVCGFGGNDVVRVVGNEHEVIDHASVSFEYENGVRGGLLLCMFSPRLEDDLEMGAIGSEGMVQTRMSKDEIHQWKRGNSSAEPIVHSLPGRKVGWGAHHGFIEAHGAFFNAIREKQRPLTDVRDCWMGTMLAIAAEEAIANGTVVEVEKSAWVLEREIPMNANSIAGMPEYLAIAPEALGKGTPVRVRVVPGDMQAIGADLAELMLREILATKASGTFIVPVGPVDQFPVLAKMINTQRIDCREMCLINMDEYLTDDDRWIDQKHPLSFRGYMDRLFYDRVEPALAPRPEHRVFPDPKNPEAIPRLIDKRGGVDVCFGGIGINGHIAFNEPPEPGESVMAEHFAALPTRCLNLTRETRTINANTVGGEISIIPHRAITIGMKECLGARKMRFYCNRLWQSAVVRRVLHGPITANCPASLLRTHADAEIAVAEYVAALPDIRLR